MTRQHLRTDREGIFDRIPSREDVLGIVLSRTVSGLRLR